jgi:hypothetical protein
MDMSHDHTDLAPNSVFELWRPIFIFLTPKSIYFLHLYKISDRSIAGCGFAYYFVNVVMVMGRRFGFVGHLPAILGENGGLLLAQILGRMEGRSISSDDRHAWTLWKMLSCCFLRIKMRGTERIIDFIRKLGLVLER